MTTRLASATRPTVVGSKIFTHGPAPTGRRVFRDLRHPAVRATAPGSLPDAAVDALAQQVGVPAVPGVLLDPVHLELPHRDAVRTEALAQVRVRGDDRVRRGLLPGEVRER